MVVWETTADLWKLIFLKTSLPVHVAPIDTFWPIFHTVQIALLYWSMHLFLVGHITTRLYRLHIVDPNSKMAVMSTSPRPQEMRKKIQLVSFPASLRMATTFWPPENWNDAWMSWLPSSWEVKGTLAMVYHLLCVTFLASEPGFITIYKFMVPNLAGRSCISAFIMKHRLPPGHQTISILRRQ